MMTENCLKRKIITVSGSTRFIDVIAVIQWYLETLEGAICLGMNLLPEWYGAEASHQAEAEGIDKEQDSLHFDKIDISHELYVVNVNHYIGKSTAREIAYAQKKGINIRYYQDDYLRHKVIHQMQRKERR